VTELQPVKISQQREEHESGKYRLNAAAANINGRNKASSIPIQESRMMNAISDEHSGKILERAENSVIRCMFL
jgi:hypothetical protein